MTFGHKWCVHNQKDKSMILCFDQLPMGLLQKLSLTDQWQFWLRPWWDVQSDWDLVKAENHWLIFLIMDIPLMAKCHLPQSMTKIYGQNFKKNVIDHGQWQKNCHLLKGIYPMIDTNNKDHIDGQLITRYHPTWICTFLTRLPLSHSEVRNGLVTWEDTWKWFDWFCSWMLCTWASGWLRVEVSILIPTLA